MYLQLTPIKLVLFNLINVMNGIKKRIGELIDERLWSINLFSKQVGIDQSNLRKKLYGESNVSKTDVRRICASLNVNEKWLLTGEGEKYKQEDKAVDTPTATETTESKAGTPYYDIDFTCSVKEVYNDEAEVPSSYMSIPGVERADFCCRTSGDSMAPYIMRGDIVAMRKVEGWSSFLPLNEVYGIVTTNGIRAIKVLRRGSDDAHLVLHSYNDDYDDQEIEKSVVLYVYRVVATARIL